MENGLTTSVPAAIAANAATSSAPPLSPADEALLSRLVKQFEDAADATVEYRRRAEHWRDYYDGDQWTDEERRALALRNQPCITDNRTADKVQYLMGLERRTRTDPKAYPRTPADEQSAEAATDALRYIFECNDFEQSRSIIFENMLVEGCGALEVVRDDKLKKDRIVKIRWDRFYYDPHSLELDFSDSLYFGVITWFDEHRLLRKYPQQREKIEGTISDANRTSRDETFEDKPTLRFVDYKRRRIQVFEHYWWNGEWMRAVFMKGAFLEPPAPSPYVDEYNVREHPYVAQCAFRDRDGNPYGVVWRYEDLQDEINKRRSKALQMLSARRVIADQGAVKDVQVAKLEVQKADGWIEAVPGTRLDIDSNVDIGMSQFQLLTETMSAFSNVGPNDALRGTSGSISGKAKQLDQEGGSVQLGALFDQIRQLQKRTARKSWNRVKQFWTEETWVRVTDDEQKLKFVGLNVPIANGELAAQKLAARGMPPEQIAQAVAQIAQDPMSQFPSGQKRNDVAQMHVDIIIDESPDMITLQSEQFAELTKLASAGVTFPPEVYVQASALRNKEALLDIMKGGGQLTPEQQEQQRMQQQMQLEMAQAELMIKKAKAMRDMAEAQKAAISLQKTEAEIRNIDADTEQTGVETDVILDQAMRPPEPAVPVGNGKPGANVNGNGGQRPPPRI